MTQTNQGCSIRLVRAGPLWPPPHSLLYSGRPGMFLVWETLSLWILLLACLLWLCVLWKLSLCVCCVHSSEAFRTELFISLVPEPRGTVSEPFSRCSPHRQANTSTGYREEAAGNTSQGLRTSNPSLGHSVSVSFFPLFRGQHFLSIFCLTEAFFFSLLHLRLYFCQSSKAKQSWPSYVLKDWESYKKLSWLQNSCAWSSFNKCLRKLTLFLLQQYST